MNIWILNHYAITPDLSGGTRHFDLAVELVARGNSVAIFASSFHYARHVDVKLSPGETYKIENVRGVKMVWLKTFPYRRNDWRRVINMVSYLWHAWRVGRRLPKIHASIPRPNVVLGSSVHLLAVLAAYWLAWQYGIPFIMEVRDLWPQTIIDIGELKKHSPVALCLYALEKFLFWRADKIVALLPYAYEYIMLRGIPKDRIVWIPNGVNLAQFEELGPPLRRKGEFRVVYMGSHGRTNALEVFLHAAKTIQVRGEERVRFVLFGDGTEKMRLIIMAADLGLRNTEFYESIPKSRVRSVLEDADVLVFSLDKVNVFKYGISPNKLFEYMAAGRPILFCVDARNNPVAENNCGLTVPPQNPEALANAVLDLSNRPTEELAAMGKRGRAYVEKYHDIRMLSLQLFRCIEQIVANDHCS